MIGDQLDVAARLRSLLPPSWFPQSAQVITSAPGGAPITSAPGGFEITNTTPGPPILAAMLNAPSTTLAFIYSLIAYVRLQTRIKTATGGNLDLIAYDFFGTDFARTSGQSDASFAAAIIQQVLLARNTRQAIIGILTSLTGNVPILFEPWRLPDSGALNLTLYYNAYGLWGSRTFPFVVFITAFRGMGVADSAIYAAVESVRAAGITCWVQILNP